MKFIKEKIRSSLLDTASLLLGQKLESDFAFSLEKPPKPEFGDLATNLALELYLQAKTLNLADNSHDLAEKIVFQLQKDGELKDLVEKIEVAGSGFINFHLKLAPKIERFWQILTSNQASKVDLGQERRVIVEFSSPNIAKPFTIGHLRSTIIGAGIANLLEESGYKVERDNHLGDWGTQFGKQLLAIEKWSNLEEIISNEEPIKKLVELYIKFHREVEKEPNLEEEARGIFAKLEKNDHHYLSMWKDIVDVSLKEFNKIYSKLFVQFSENEGKGFGESFAARLSDQIIEELVNKNLLTESQGAKIIEFPPEKKLPPLIIVKKDGASIYATRDLAIDKFRLEKYGPDLIIINEVGKEQQLYFRQLYQTEEMLGWFKPGQRIHLAHGLYRFKDKKMSTRKGEVVWLEEIIGLVEQKVKNLNPELSLEDNNTIAMGALKWQDLSREALNDIEFNLEEMLNLRGNSGPYLQYTVVRARSILKKDENKPFVKLFAWKEDNKESNLLEIKTSLFQNQWSSTEMALLNKILSYEEVICQSTKSLSLHWLASYLYELAQIFNNFYNQEKISENDLRLGLTKVVEIILTRGLYILGIQIPTKM